MDRVEASQRKRRIKAEREMVRPYRARRPISRSSYWALEIVSSRVSRLASTELTVTARLADRLNQYLGRAIDWRILGEDGAKISDTQRLLAATESGSFDWIVVSVGVNDVTGLTSLVRWQQGLLGLISEIRSRSSHATVVFLQLPPMGRFEMIPQPLRAVLGIRAAMLRQVLTWIVEAHRGVWMIDPSRLFDPAYMAEDGYHPNEIAVDWMASEICATVKVAESSR